MVSQLWRLRGVYLLVINKTLYHAAIDFEVLFNCFYKEIFRHSVYDNSAIYHFGPCTITFYHMTVKLFSEITYVIKII